jgi:hypothetical protein
MVTGVSEAIGSGAGGEVSLEQEAAASTAMKPTKRIGTRKLVFTGRM